MDASVETSGWRDLFLKGGWALPVFVGGVGLQAIEAFIGSAMLPTVVREIGGLGLFAWNTTVFIVFSIVATVFAGLRPASIGPRGAYIIAATIFAAGSAVCGASPTMLVLLAGRALQGFGGGLIVATSLAMLQLIFPQRLWPRAMALNALVWGVATLLGPAIGGVLAQLGIWRWAYLGMVPLAALLALGAWHTLPKVSMAASRTSAPIASIALVVGAILFVSISSVLTASALWSGALLALAIVCLLLLRAVEGRGEGALLPQNALSPRTPIGAQFGTMALLGVLITSDIFAPLLLQRLHGAQPISAGYITALTAAGWTLAALISASWSEARVGRAIAAAPIIMFLATSSFLWTLAQPSTNPGVLIGAGFGLFALGAGIGMAFQHLQTRILAAAPAAENNRVSAAVGMVQLFASGLGAAIGGFTMNAAGLPTATTAEGLSHAAFWLFAIFALIAAAGVPLALRATRGIGALER
jgi:MFS family permease